MHWEDEAQKRLQKAPFFVRFFIKQRAEAEAQKRNMASVTPALLDELKSKEHRG